MYGHERDRINSHDSRNMSTSLSQRLHFQKKAQKPHMTVYTFQEYQ